MRSGPVPSVTDRLLVGLSRLAVRPETRDEVLRWIRGPVSWGELVERAGREGVSPLVYRSLRSIGGPVPEDVLASLRKVYFANEARNTRLFHRIHPLLEATRAAGLRTVLTKGARLALTVYPEIGLRPFTDVDLVVHPGDWAALETALAGSGFAPEPGGRVRLHPRNRALDWTFSPYYRQGELVIELHFTYLGLHMPFRSEADFWASARSVSMNGAEALITSPEYELCTLCLHAQQHSYGRLMWLTDIAELAPRPEIDRDKVARISHREGIGPVVRYGFELVNSLWPGTIPSPFVCALGRGHLAAVLQPAFWPPAAVARRADRTPLPYYTPTFFTLLSRRKPLTAARTLLRILFPPMAWIADSYNVAPGSPRAWLRYLRRLGAPFAWLLKKKEREA